MTEVHEEARQRVFVLGLDGATFDLIEPWARSGLLPTFQRLMAEGCWGDLTSTIPPFTAPAWCSFATGTNPGKHGMYDFAGRKPGTYEMIPLNATSLRSVPMWHRLGRQGKRVVVLDVPVTYPPRPVNGYLVTGMLTPVNAPTFTHPPELGAEILRAVPRYAVWPEGVFHPLGREKELLDVVQELTESRFELTRYLLGRADWDFFMVVFRGPDLVQHWLWRFMESKEGGPLGNGIPEVYRKIDRILAAILEMLPPRTTLMLMSDHGAGPLDHYIHVNTWLLQEGFLRVQPTIRSRLKLGMFRMGITPRSLYRAVMGTGLRRGVGSTVRRRKSEVRAVLDRAFLSFEDVDWPRTRAYSYGNVGPIYINLKGREPQGCVELGADYERVREELAARLMGLRDPVSGTPLVDRVYRKEELYHGGAVDAAPDLFFMPRDLRYQAFGLLQFTSNRWLEPSFDRSGGHRMNGMLLFWGHGVRAGRTGGARMIDLAPTILALLGSPIPREMDGAVLHDCFEEDLWKERPIRHCEEDLGGLERVEGFEDEDVEEITQRLKGLGYV